MGQDTTKKGTSIKRRTRRTKGGLASIDAIIPKTVKRLKLSEQFDKLTLEKHYEEIFGKELNIVSHPDKLIKGMLHINVSSSAWLMQLSFMKDEFKDKINEYFNKRVVRKVNFRVGDIKKKSKEVKPAAREGLNRVKLDDTTKKIIKESVKGIKDNALKKSIIAAETAYFKRKKEPDS